MAFTFKQISQEMLNTFILGMSFNREITEEDTPQPKSPH